MNELAVEIAKDKQYSIYLLQGTENVKSELMASIDEYAGGIKTIPKKFLEPHYNPIDDDGSQFEEYIDLVTVGILIADFLIIYLDNFDDVSGEKIKEIVSDDFFKSFHYLVDRKGGPIKRKLIIVSPSKFQESIFYTNPGLNARCKFF